MRTFGQGARNRISGCMRGSADDRGRLQHAQPHGAMLKRRGEVRVQQWLRHATGAVKLPALVIHGVGTGTSVLYA